MIRRFHLQRAEDVHGVSGTGRVAEGCQFENGMCGLVALAVRDGGRTGSWFRFPLKGEGTGNQMSHLRFPELVPELGTGCAHEHAGRSA